MCIRTVVRNAYYLRHVRLSACISAAPSRQIYVKFNIGYMFEKSVRKLQILSKLH
jgi:hypothetical protein